MTGPPSPRMLFLRLVGRAALVHVASAALLVATVLPVLGLGLDDVPSVAGLGAFLALAGVAATALSAAVAVASTRRLHRSLDARARGERGPGRIGEATARAYVAPERMVAAVVLTQLAGIALEAALRGSSRAAVALYASSVCLLALHPSLLVFRRGFWAWLSRVPPAELALPADGSIGRRTLARVVVPVASFCVGVGAVAAARFDTWAAIAAAAVALAVVVGAAVAARALGRAVARDISELGRHIGEMARAVGPVDRGGAECRSEAAAGLADGIDRLAARYSQLSSVEARARASMEDAQRLKTQFMAYVSHDLKSPLNSIRGFAQVLLRGTDGELEEAQRESVQMILDSGDDLLRLVTDITDSTRLEAGRLVLRRDWTPSVELVRDAVALVAPTAGDGGLEVRTELAAGLPPVWVDARRIVQALGGILVHVSRVMDHGAAFVRVRASERWLHVEVEAPRGIGPGDRERIFEAFREMKEPSGRRIGGLGLGLSLARGLVAEHGGELSCSASGDEGTTFLLTLPLDGPGV